MRMWWVCDSCQKQGRGDVLRVTTGPGDLDGQVTHAVNTAGRHLIPVGWATYGAKGVYCPECKP